MNHSSSHSFTNCLNFIGSVITYFRNFVLNAIFLLVILFVILSSIAYNNQQNEKNKNLTYTPDTSMVMINFNGPIRDAPYFMTSFESFLYDLDPKSVPENRYHIKNYIDVINYATNDSKVKTLFLNLSNLTNLRSDITKNLLQALTKFKAKDKKIYVYSMYYDQQKYALASVADKVYLDPMGGVNIKGYSLSSLYFKDLLDNLLITVHTPKVGTHKSAVEPFNRNDMSSWVKDEYRHIVTNLWREYEDVLLRNRNVEPSEYLFASDEYLKQLESFKGDAANMALSLGFVDFIGTYNDVIDDISKETNVDIGIIQNKRNLKGTSFSSYLSNVQKNTEKSSSKNIAILYGIGEMSSSSDDLNDFTSVNLVPQIRRLANDKSVKAVVFYLNTPGGEVFASEVMRREMNFLRSKGKKVVIYMASMAASGGYYISTESDYIIATPTTITGSIGVYGMMITAENVAKKIGVNVDGVTMNPHSNNTIFEGVSPNLMKAIQLGIEDTYHDFLKLVSDSRNISMLDADKIAQGQIYTGYDAKEIHLVDQIGTFEDAIEKAASLTDLKSYGIIYSYPDEDELENGNFSLFTGKLLSLVDKGLAYDYVKSLENKIPKQVKSVLTEQSAGGNKDYILYSVSPVELQSN